MTNTSLTGPRTLFCAVGLALTCALPVPAFAQPEVRGNADAMQIDAQNASLGEVLTALRESFGVRYNGRAKLDGAISGSYSGPLQRVISRLLTGHNYLMSVSHGEIQITFLDNGSSPIAPVQTARPAPAGAPPVQASAANLPPGHPSTAATPAVTTGTQGDDKSAVVPMPKQKQENPVPLIRVADGSSPQPPIPKAGGAVPTLTPPNPNTPAMMPTPPSNAAGAMPPIPKQDSTSGAAAMPPMPTQASSPVPAQPSAPAQPSVPAQTSGKP